MNSRFRTAGTAMTAASAVLALFPVGAALAADRHDNGSEGVEISVLIAPLQACVGACSGGGGQAGGGAGTGALPPTGGALPLTAFWIAAALLAIGLAFVLWQRTRLATAGGTLAGRGILPAGSGRRPASSTAAEPAARAERSVT